MRLLVVEDNPQLAGLLQRGFTDQGFDVDVAVTGQEGQQKAANQPYDCTILDVMLPDIDGLSICRTIREKGVKTPVLMLTALSATGEKVAGLDAGADDYQTKPFEFDELLARVRALVRRSREDLVLKYADLELDLAQRRATRGGQRIKLTAKEFALVEYFMRNADKLLTRTIIGKNVWDTDFDRESNVIDVYVSMVRRKIDKGFMQPLLHTVVGSGYLMSTQRPDGHPVHASALPAN